MPNSLPQATRSGPLERIVRHHCAARYRTPAVIARAAKRPQVSRIYPDQYANRAQKGRPAAPNDTQWPEAKRGSFESRMNTPPATAEKTGSRATFEPRTNGNDIATSSPATSGKAETRRFTSAEFLPMWCLTLELSGGCRSANSLPQPTRSRPLERIVRPTTPTHDDGLTLASRMHRVQERSLRPQPTAHGDSL
jgi:hypothetical protein